VLSKVRGEREGGTGRREKRNGVLRRLGRFKSKGGANVDDRGVALRVSPEPWNRGERKGHGRGKRTGRKSLGFLRMGRQRAECVFLAVLSNPVGGAETWEKGKKRNAF